MGDRVSVDLVVHLRRLGQVVEGLRDGHRLLPEGGQLRLVQLERLDDMPLCHHAHVSGKRRSGWGRYPDRWKFCDHVEWRAVAADDAGSHHVESLAATANQSRSRG